MAHLKAILEERDPSVCELCDPENSRPIRLLERDDYEDGAMRLCFPHAVELLRSSDSRERESAMLVLNLASPTL
jgi:hypothetical protein